MAGYAACVVVDEVLIIKGCQMKNLTKLGILYRLLVIQSVDLWGIMQLYPVAE